MSTLIPAIEQGRGPVRSRQTYAVSTSGGSVRPNDSVFRITYACDGGPCVIWSAASDAPFALTLFRSPSGSGKTTLLTALYNRLVGQEPDREERRKPTRLEELKRRILRRKLNEPESPLRFDFNPNLENPAGTVVGFIPQRPPTVSHWRVRNLLPPNPLFLSCFFADPKSSDFKLNRIGRLSGGQCLKIYACSALERLATAPGLSAFLLLDETFDGLGAEEAGRCMNAIRTVWLEMQAAKSGDAPRPLHVLWVTHLDVAQLGVGSSRPNYLRAAVRALEDHELQVELSNKQ